MVTHTDQVLTINLLNDVDDPAEGKEAGLFVAPARLLADDQQLVQQSQTANSQLISQTLTQSLVTSSTTT